MDGASVTAIGMRDILLEEQSRCPATQELSSTAVPVPVAISGEDIILHDRRMDDGRTASSRLGERQVKPTRRARRRNLRTNARTRGKGSAKEQAGDTKGRQPSKSSRKQTKST